MAGKTSRTKPVSITHPIPFPGESPDGFEAWLKRVAMPAGNCYTNDGRVLEMHELRAGIGQIPAGSQLSRRTLECVYRGDAYSAAIPAQTAPKYGATLITPADLPGTHAEGPQKP